MTEDENYIIMQLNRLYKIEYYSKLVKLLPHILFVVLCPIVIYHEFISEKFLIASLLFIAELAFLFLSYSLYLSLKENTSFARSRIYKCFENREMVNKIIVSNNKILFDISDMEDEALHLNKSKYRDEIINSLKSVFGESKLVFND